MTELGGKVGAVQRRRAASGHRSQDGGALAAEFEESFSIESVRRYVVENRTPCCIQIHDNEFGDLHLAPLARREIDGERLAGFGAHLIPLRQRNQLRIRLAPLTRRSPGTRSFLSPLAPAALAVIFFDMSRFGTLYRIETFAVVLTLCAVALIAAVLEAVRQRRAGIVSALSGDDARGLADTHSDSDDGAYRTKNATLLLIVLFVGAVLPAIAIFVATDAGNFLVMDGGLSVKAGLESRLVPRLIQVIYTAVLSLFPALVYFQFDRQRVGTIRGRWIRAIFGMDPQMETLADIEARYGDQLGEATSFSTDTARFLGGHYSPIIVATILVSLGWIVLILPTKGFDFASNNELSTVVAAANSASERAQLAAETGSVSGAQDAAAEAFRNRDRAIRIVSASTGSSTILVSEPDVPDDVDEAADAAALAARQARDAQDQLQAPFFEVLDRKPSASTMAFLGAYFFAVYLALRGYFQGDLRPKVYNQISARLVTVVVLAYLIDVMFDPSAFGEKIVWSVAFLAGVVPFTVLQSFGLLISSRLVGPPSPNEIDEGIPGKEKGWFAQAFAKAFETPRALTQIDGIDIYESARLESEGVTDIPSLAKSDLASMMVNTRLPVERLVDWSDQAMLLLLVKQGSNDEHVIQKLRLLGIRTATSLAGVALDPLQAGRRDEAARIIGGESLLQGLAFEIEKEPSIRCIQNWRQSALDDLDPSIRRPIITAGDPVPSEHLVAAGDGITPTPPPEPPPRPS